MEYHGKGNFMGYCFRDASELSWDSSKTRRLWDLAGRMGLMSPEWAKSEKSP